jgi:predicted ATPase
MSRVPVTNLHGGEPAFRRPPRAVAELVGRDRERAAVADALATARLLTLTGVGGSGKTRLGLDIATDVAKRYRDGVVWVDLAPVDDPIMVPVAVADAVGVRNRRIDGLQEALCDHLAAHEVLVLVDNCEHLLEGCRPLLASLLRAAPNVAVLATSRSALRLDGEVGFPVPPLPVPPAGAMSVAEVMGTDAVRLFELRARQVRPAFRAVEHLVAVAEICRRLDGLPLALELAAARIRVLTPAQILQALDDRFALLTGGRHDALPRQRTLATSVAWSTSLLEDRDRLVFARLGVFAGAFDLDAARAVAAGGTVSAAEVLDRLTELAEHSLLQVDSSRGGARYRLLETIRAHARDLLAQLEDPAIAQGRHVDHYLALASDAHQGLVGPEPGRWLERLDTELEELRTAMDRAITLGRPLAVLAIAGGASDFFATRGLYTELQRRLTAAVTPPSVTDAERARGLTYASLAALMGGDFPGGHDSANDAVPAAEAASDTETLARALATRAWCGFFSGVAARTTIDADLARALQLGTEVDDPEGHARPAMYAGVLELFGGSIAEGHRRLVAAAEEIQEAGLAFMLPPVHTFLAYGDAMLDGDLAAARTHGARALRSAEQLGLYAFVSMARAALGTIATFRGDAAAARRHLAVAREVAEQHGLTTFVMIAQRWSAFTAYRFDDPDAATTARTAWLLADDTGSGWDRTAADWLEATVALRRGHLDDASEAFNRALDGSRDPAGPALSPSTGPPPSLERSAHAAAAAKPGRSRTHRAAPRPHQRLPQATT